MPGAPRNVNTAKAITWLVGTTIYCTIFNSNSPPLRQFLLYKIVLKKLAREILTEQIIEFELRGHGAHWPTAGYFHDKTKISKESSRELLFPANILQKAMYTLLPPPA